MTTTEETAMTTTAVRVHPSDVVVWKYDTAGSRCSLRKLNDRMPFLDKTDYNRPSRHWFARIDYDEPMPEYGYPDPDGRWTLVTQGDSPGGRRYRVGLTLIEAQRVALAWLDRRFKLPTDLAY